MTADIPRTEQCRGCGAAMAAGAEWCGQCYLPRTAPTSSAPAAASAPATASAEPSIMAGTWQQSAARPPVAMVKTRWKKTPTTFGPVGRVVCTFLLIVPLPLLIIGTIVSGGLEIVGLGIWVFVIMPWALRDIWKAGSLPAG